MSAIEIAAVPRGDIGRAWSHRARPGVDATAGHLHSTGHRRPDRRDCTENEDWVIAHQPSKMSMSCGSLAAKVVIEPAIATARNISGGRDYLHHDETYDENRVIAAIITSEGIQQAD